MILAIVAYYVCISVIVFLAWLNFFIQDPTTPNTHLMSWIVLIIGSSLWIVIVPLAYKELRPFRVSSEAFVGVNGVDPH